MLYRKQGQGRERCHAEHSTEAEPVYEAFEIQKLKSLYPRVSGAPHGSALCLDNCDLNNSSSERAIRHTRIAGMLDISADVQNVDAAHRQTAGVVIINAAVPADFQPGLESS